MTEKSVFLKRKGKDMLFYKYKIQFILILLATLLIGMVQQWIAENSISFFATLSHFFTLILAPMVFAAFLTGVMWYLGRKITPSRIFYSYLFSWLGVALFSTITIIKIYS
jgi:uncharacterized Tic20 family protein